MCPHASLKPLNFISQAPDLNIRHHLGLFIIQESFSATDGVRTRRETLLLNGGVLLKWNMGKLNRLQHRYLNAFVTVATFILTLLRLPVKWHHCVLYLRVQLRKPFMYPFRIYSTQNVTETWQAGDYQAELLPSRLQHRLPWWCSQVKRAAFMTNSDLTFNIRHEHVNLTS